MKNKKGFTLIELLAIIVILAIIAVITVPIILNVIDNSKKGAAIDSAYGYKEAIYKGFLNDLTLDQNKVLPSGVYVIDSSGKLVNSNGVVLSAVVSGTVPTEGWVQLDRGNVIAYSLRFDDYVITKYQDTEAEAVKNGEIAENVEAREARLESERQTRAIETAKGIASSQSGTTEIIDITDGWVAFINGELKAYSIKVVEGDYTYVVTDLDVDSSNSHAVADRTTSELASKTSAEQAIISYKVDSYVKAALSANSSLDKEDAKTISDLGDLTNKADSGWIHFNKVNNSIVVVDYSLTYGSITANYSSLTNDNYVSTFSEARNKPVIFVGTIKEDGAKYLSAALEVYYNPVTGAKNCDGQEGCMHWYLYSVKGEYANMLLDHNITDANSNSVAWALSADYTDEKSASAGITYPGISSIPSWSSSKNSRGPVTALNTLKSLTSGWISTQTPKVPNQSSTNEHIITKDKNNNKYQIDYTGYKARLITLKEIQYLGCNFNSNSCPEWMIKGTRGENSITYANVYGYWTSYPRENSSDVWYVTYSGSYYNMSSADSISNGLRPVITVLMSDI